MITGLLKLLIKIVCIFVGSIVMSIVLIGAMLIASLYDTIFAKNEVISDSLEPVLVERTEELIGK